LRRNEHWTYNGHILEIVNSFNYLGFVFNNGGSCRKGIENLAGKGLKSIFALINLTKNTSAPIKLTLDLFDTYVASVLSYCSEIWGFSQAETIERVHRKYLKRILNVKMSTNTLALYGETGRYPLIISRKIKIIKYWFKLINSYSTNTILYATYITLLNDCESRNNWLSNVRQLLQDTGFNDVWMFRDSVISPKQFIAEFKIRLKDIHISEWRHAVGQSSALELFNALKPNYGMSEYIITMDNAKHIQALAKIRLSSHKLMIEQGRHRHIAREDRKCELCSRNEIEDEFHFILICDVYGELRARYIPPYYRRRPWMFKLVQLLNVRSKTVQHRLSKYILQALKLRDNFINVRV
jgi:hypothetical protein